MPTPGPSIIEIGMKLDNHVDGQAGVYPGTEAERDEGREREREREREKYIERKRERGGRRKRVSES